MSKKLAGLALLALAGCSNYYSNVEWAYEHDIKPVIRIIPKKYWHERASKLLKNKFINPKDIACMHKNIQGLDYIFIREGHQYCIEHEFGHIREEVLGLRCHSAYAR